MKIGHLGTVVVYLWSDVDCEIRRLEAGLTLAALILDSFWSRKRRVLSANLWRADLFFLFFGFVRLMLSVFFCVDAV